MHDRLGKNLKQRLWAEHQAGVDDVGDEAQGNTARPTASKLAQWAGGLVSLGLVLGMVYWVFELGRRDANEVPVIQAMGGVARDLPEDNQATIVPHQGLQVNEVLAGDNTAPVEPETTLAPPPQRVVDEDTQADAPPAQPTAPLELVSPPPQTDTQTDTAPPFTLPPSLPGADPNMTRPARRVQAAGLSENADLLSDAIADAISELTVPTEEASPNTPAPTVPTVAFVDEKMVQFGTYDDEPSALQELERLLAEHQDVIASLTRFVERREAGGRVFYRLRARGIAGFDAAETICTTLLARGVQCIALP